MLDIVRKNAEKLKQHKQAAAEIGLTSAPDDKVPRLGPYSRDDPEAHEANKESPQNDDPKS